VKARPAARQATLARLSGKLARRGPQLFTRCTGRRLPSTARLRQLASYATVSAISTGVTLSLLGVLIYTKTLSPGWANVVATGVGTVPSFELNRRWVWAKRTRRSIFKEVVPFCGLSFSGLGLSTVVVSLAASWSTAAGLGSGATALISQGANLATFGALWVLQFFLLDRVLFGGRSGAAQQGVAVRPTAGVRSRTDEAAGAGQRAEPVGAPGPVRPQDRRAAERAA